MPLSHRIERIAEQLREEVSQILATDVADPGVGLVTVSRVKVTPDLSLARVYWTSSATPPSEERTDKALQRAAPFVRHVLAGRGSRCAACPRCSSSSTKGWRRTTASRRSCTSSTRRKPRAPRRAEAAPDGRRPPVPPTSRAGRSSAARR